jgi:hypothetical protein
LQSHSPPDVLRQVVVVAAAAHRDPVTKATPSVDSIVPALQRFSPPQAAKQPNLSLLLPY